MSQRPGPYDAVLICGYDEAAAIRELSAQIEGEFQPYHLARMTGGGVQKDIYAATIGAFPGDVRGHIERAHWLYPDLVVYVDWSGDFPVSRTVTQLREGV